MVHVCNSFDRIGDRAFCRECWREPPGPEPTGYPYPVGVPVAERNRQLAALWTKCDECIQEGCERLTAAFRALLADAALHPRGPRRGKKIHA
jgi:hypothetical protein